MKKSLVILGIVYVMGVTLLSAKEVVSETPLGYKGVNCKYLMLTWHPFIYSNPCLDPLLSQKKIVEKIIKGSKYITEKIGEMVEGN